MSSAARDRRTAAVIATAVGALCVYAIRQVDPDLYGHLVYGRLFLEHGGPVGQDPFGYTSAGTRWVAFEYLAQMSIAQAYEVFGPVGLILWKCVLGGLALWCVWRAIRVASDDPVVTLPVFALCALPIGRYFLFRPQVVTFACFALFVAVLFRYMLSHRARLWMLPVVMIVWVNSHGGFVAGLGAIGLAGLVVLVRDVSKPGHGTRGSGGWRPLMVTFVACALMTFVTPFGTTLWRYVLTELTHGTNRRYVAEWQPVSWTAEPWSLIALIVLSVAVLASAWFAGQARRQIHGLWSWQWGTTCVPLLVMSAISVRHVPLAATWTAPVLAILADAAWRTRPTRALARAWLLIAVVASIPVVVALQHVLQRPVPSISVGGNLLGNRDPCRIANVMQEQHVTGNVYVPLWWGSYLTWRLYPAVRVSVDGRNISAFPADVVLEDLRFFTEPNQDPRIPLRYQTDLLLMPTDAPALEAVRGSSQWREVYADADAALFRRADRPGPSLGRARSAVGPCGDVLR